LSWCFACFRRCGLENFRLGVGRADPFERREVLVFGFEPVRDSAGRRVRNGRLVRARRDFGRCPFDRQRCRGPFDRQLAVG
jgi:hypothetical protein